MWVKKDDGYSLIDVWNISKCREIWLKAIDMLFAESLNVLKVTIVFKCICMRNFLFEFTEINYLVPKGISDICNMSFSYQVNTLSVFSLSQTQHYFDLLNKII